MLMRDLYDQNEIARLVGISESQIRYWDSSGLIPRADKQKGLLFFDFKGLVAFRTAKELIGRGVSLRAIRSCIQKLKKIMPEVEQPLSEVRITIHDKQIVFSRDNLTFTPDGQLLIDFSLGVRQRVDLVADSSEELFFQALECESDSQWEEAARKYEAILRTHPDHVDAMVNLGNALLELGSPEKAEEYYREALALEPDHVEANYNLANLFEERGELGNALLFYRKALQEEPEFADAHYNLAQILDALDKRQAAREHWLCYLELEPHGEWAGEVRQRLAEE
jgi:tetratricopeptide (TPR) repeat protein